MPKKLGKKYQEKILTLFNFGDGSDQIFRAEFLVHHPSSHYTGNKTAGAGTCLVAFFCNVGIPA